jgi:transposase
MKEKSVIIKAVMKFLEIFMCKTLAQRITSMILLAVGMPNKQIAEITGFCERSVRDLKKRIETEEIGKLFVVGGGGRKRKLKDVESAISEEIEQNNYHSRQQVADMILEKYGIKVSLPCVGRLLKKTGLSD